VHSTSVESSEANGVASWQIVEHLVRSELIVEIRTACVLFRPDKPTRPIVSGPADMRATAVLPLENDQLKLILPLGEAPTTAYFLSRAA